MAKNFKISKIILFNLLFRGSKSTDIFRDKMLTVTTAKSSSSLTAEMRPTSNSGWVTSLIATGTKLSNIAITEETKRPRAQATENSVSGLFIIGVRSGSFGFFSDRYSCLLLSFVAVAISEITHPLFDVGRISAVSDDELLAVVTVNITVNVISEDVG